MRRATPIVLMDSEREQLERLSRGRRVSVRLAQRASIVLHAADGLENKQIGDLLGVTRQTAGRWRDRYAASGLKGIEKDAPRPGRKRRVDERQRAAVVRKTLREKPEGQTHWSRSTMAAANRRSAPSITGRLRAFCDTLRLVMAELGADNAKCFTQVVDVRPCRLGGLQPRSRGTNSTSMRRPARTSHDVEAQVLRIAREAGLGYTRILGELR